MAGWENHSRGTLFASLCIWPLKINQQYICAQRNVQFHSNLIIVSLHTWMVPVSRFRVMYYLPAAFHNSELLYIWRDCWTSTENNSIVLLVFLLPDRGFVLILSPLCPPHWHWNTARPEEPNQTEPRVAPAETGWRRWCTALFFFFAILYNAVTCSLWSHYQGFNIWRPEGCRWNLVFFCFVYLLFWPSSGQAAFNKQII